LITSAF